MGCVVASSSVEQPQARSTPGTAVRACWSCHSRPPRESHGSYWLGEGSAVILTDSLTALGLPVMRRDERLHSFELLRVPVVSGLSQATVIRVGQVVGASQVIVGTFTLTGDTLTVRARAILLDTGLGGAGDRRERTARRTSSTSTIDSLFASFPAPRRRLRSWRTVILRSQRSSSSSRACWRRRRRRSSRFSPRHFDWPRICSEHASRRGTFTTISASTSGPWLQSGRCRPTTGLPGKRASWRRCPSSN